MRSAQEVAASRPLRRFKASGWPARTTPESLRSFRAPFPVADSIFSVACVAISFRLGGARLKSDPPTISQSYPPAPVDNLEHRTLI